MNKQHFEKIAKVLCLRLNEAEDEVVVEQIARDLADVFAEANPRFSHSMFLTACGLVVE